VTVSNKELEAEWKWTPADNYQEDVHTASTIKGKFTPAKK